MMGLYGLSRNIHQVHGLTLNLISISQLTDNDLTVTFTSSACLVQDHLTDQRIGTDRRICGLYNLDLHLSASSTSTSTSASASNLNASISTVDRWHRHLSNARLKLT